MTAVRWIAAALAFAAVWMVFGTIMIGTIEKSGFAPVVAIVTGGMVGLPALAASAVLCLGVSWIALRLGTIIVLALAYSLLVKLEILHDDPSDKLYQIMAIVTAASAGAFALVAPSVRLFGTAGHDGEGR